MEVTGEMLELVNAAKMIVSEGMLETGQMLETGEMIEMVNAVKVIATGRIVERGQMLETGEIILERVNSVSMVKQ